MAKKKKRTKGTYGKNPPKKRKVLKKRRVAKKTISTVMQNKQVAALPIIAAYDFRILESNKQPSVWDDE